jgi:tetratricopeptide (TPR) repeat protein
MLVCKVLLLSTATAFSFLSLWAQEGDYQKGVSFFKQKQYEKAIVEFEAIVEEYPEYEFGHRMLGFSYLHLKQHQKSIAEFREALRLREDLFESYLGLARAYFNSKQFEEVIATLDQGSAHVKSPGHRYELLRTKGIAEFNINRYEASISDLEGAREIRRGEVKDLLRLGLAHYHMRNLEKAGEYLKQVLAINPSSIQASRFLGLVGYARGILLIENQKYAEAAEKIASYTEKDPDNAEAWFNLGLAYLFSGNLVAAEGAFLKDTLLRPEGGDSFARLGYLYEKRKDFHKSLSAYEKAADLGHVDARLSVDRIKKRLRRGG